MNTDQLYYALKRPLTNADILESHLVNVRAASLTAGDAAHWYAFEVAWQAAHLFATERERREVVVVASAFDWVDPATHTTPREFEYLLDNPGRRSTPHVTR